MAKVPNLPGAQEEVQLSSLKSAVLFLREARTFVTPGKRGKGKYDYVGIVLERFFYSTPEFERSLVSKVKRPNGWTLQGSWPSAGRQLFDWEMEVWGERGGQVVVKTNMWSRDGFNDGQSWKVTLANVDSTVPKWLRKFFYPTKALMKVRSAKK